MKFFTILLFILLLTTGCKTTPIQTLSQEPIRIDQWSLDKYWVQTNTAFSVKTNNYNMPKKGGFVNIEYLIDSNGNIFNPTIVKSDSTGAWNKFALKALSNMKYENSKTNTQKIPVYVVTEFIFGI